MKKSQDATDKTIREKYKTNKYYEYESDFQSDLQMHDYYITDFDAYEAMLVSKTYDSVSKQTKNGITDSDAATMVIERSARVVGQLPTGETTAAGRKDAGKALFMDILRQKWIYPNANAQRPFLDKVRLWEMYSGVYGFMPMYVDWDVSPTGYVGPNCWLWSPRNFIPQQGRFSIADMDYVHAISYLSHTDIQNLIDNWTVDSGWDKENLKAVLEIAKNSSKSPDTKRDSFVERERQSSEVKDRVMVVTRYEAGDDGQWVTFTPDMSCMELRSIDNPHKNGRIPFVIKPSIPLFDSFYNLAEMARAKPIQFAKDGLTNFYFQGIKMNIYPPTVVNANGILKHTVSQEPGAIWEEITPNSARRLETSTAGLATYQAAMGQMSGALQNVFGTTTTQLSAEQAMSPQMGKTPEAIKYQSNRESARDNQNRAYLQSAIEEMVDLMYSLIVNIGTEDIPIDLFAEDIMAIQKAGYDDLQKLFKKKISPNESGQSVRIVIDPKQLKGVEYRFNMKADSTVKSHKQEQRQDLLEFISVVGKHQNELQEIQKTSGMRPNWEVIFQRYAELADLGIDDIFIKEEAPQNPDDHPVMKLLTALNIKFESLPEDAKQQVLAMIGVKSNMPSPKQQEMDIKHAETTIKAIQSTQQPDKQEPQAESVGGNSYTDPHIAATAKEIGGLR
jgi:hypothetical protein